MRLAGGAADLEQRRPRRGAAPAPARIGDGRPAAPAGAEAHRRHRGDKQGEGAPDARLRLPDEHGPALRRSGREGWTGEGGFRLARTGDPAGDGERRHEGGEDQQHRRPGRVPGFQAQPEMKADDRVQPDDHEQQRLLEGGIRPQAAQYDVVGVVAAVEAAVEARRRDMRGDEQRDGEAEGDLHSLPRSHAPGAAAGQLPEGKADMDCGGAIEQERARPGAPDLDAHGLRRLHGVQGDMPERVVEKMRQRESEQHEPGGEAPNLRITPPPFAPRRASLRGSVARGAAHARLAARGRQPMKRSGCATPGSVTSNVS